MGFFSAVKKFFGSKENEAAKGDEAQVSPNGEELRPEERDAHDINLVSHNEEISSQVSEGEPDEAPKEAKENQQGEAPLAAEALVEVEETIAAAATVPHPLAEENTVQTPAGDLKEDIAPSASADLESLITEKSDTDDAITQPLAEENIVQTPAEDLKEDIAPSVTSNLDSLDANGQHQTGTVPVSKEKEAESVSLSAERPSSATDEAEKTHASQIQVNLADSYVSPIERTGFVLPKRFQRHTTSDSAPSIKKSETAVLPEMQVSERGTAPLPESEADLAAIYPEREAALEQAKASSPTVAQSPEDVEIIKRLREAEPRLSQWLNIVLEGQEEVGEVFWHRIRFLLRSLEAPEAETEEFVSDFAQWLKRMDYVYVDEFRSELQYRLALALDLEDEEDERNSLLLRLSQGLAATREKLSMGLNALFSGHGQLDNAFWEELEELFIMADLGYATAVEIVARLKRRAVRENVAAVGDVRRLLQDELEEIFKQEPRIKAVNKPEVVLMMGVNGAGKTTTIAKLAHREKMSGKKVLIVAADTFRAAAIEQLQVWADRVGVDFFARPEGSDPASVAWGAMDFAREHDSDVIFVDTAGRLQTRVNLMEELGKIRQVLAKKHPGAPHRNVLVLDATTGQNALSQAKLFREAAGADELILTKLDGTAKGGVAIAVAMQEHLPITYIGLGEKMDDLRPFHGSDFARALLRDLAEEQEDAPH